MTAENEDQTELLAALEILAPDYVHALKERDAWKTKAANDEHPGRGFCLRQAELWDNKAKDILAKAKGKA